MINVDYFVIKEWDWFVMMMDFNVVDNIILFDLVFGMFVYIEILKFLSGEYFVFIIYVVEEVSSEISIVVDVVWI